jgi:ATP-dependent helicase HrpA
VPAQAHDTRYKEWGFGELPELMEIKKGGTTLIGFPGADRPWRCRHRGVRRARGGGRQAPRGPAPPVCAADPRCAQVPGKEHSRSAEDGRGLYAAGHAGELRGQIIDVAMDRAFLQDPLPANEADFKQRVQDGRGRLTLIANEVARMAPPS